MVDKSGERSFSKSDALLSSIKDQQKLYESWLQEDSRLVNQFLLRQSFESQDPFTFKSKDFKEEGDYDFSCSISGEWEDLSAESGENFLKLKSKLVQMPVSLNIRSLALELKFRVRLAYHSSFYVFLRVFNEITSDTPVIKISKDCNLRGIFVIFANINPANKKFKFIKQNQVPEPNNTQDQDKNLEIGIIDNGNDRIFVSVSSYGQGPQVKPSNFSCSGFLPQVNDSSVWLAGIGEGVHLNTLSLKYRERILFKSTQKKSPDCTCIII